MRLLSGISRTVFLHLQCSRLQSHLVLCASGIVTDEYCQDQLHNTWGQVQSQSAGPLCSRIKNFMVAIALNQAWTCHTQEAGPKHRWAIGQSINRENAGLALRFQPEPLVLWAPFQMSQLMHGCPGAPLLPPPLIGRKTQSLVASGWTLLCPPETIKGQTVRLIEEQGHF